MEIDPEMSIDWHAVGEEGARLLCHYLQLDTTNPPGNERRAADFLTGVLRERGFEPQLYESGPGRANVLARLRGNGSRRPILLLHHMDVVPAEASEWSVAPFGGVRRDGYLYGRGAIDMKCAGIMHVLALDLLARMGRPLKRDVILMAVSDEEMEGRYGTAWMLDHLWPEIQPEFVWDEGGFGLVGMLGHGPVFYVAVTEKQVLWPRLVVRGEPGLASIPRGNNPIDVLIRALDRIGRWRPRPRLTAVSREMLIRLAPEMGLPRSFLLRHVDHPLIWPIVSRVVTRLPQINAMLRDLVTITQLSAGDKENVIPHQATAGLDLRLLPDTDPDLFLARLRRVIGDDRVQIEWPPRPARSGVSPMTGDFIAALEDALHDLVPDCTVVPMLTPGGSDSRFFRRRGVAAYGLIPILLTEHELGRMHGVDERISIENLRLGTRVVFQVLRAMCG